MPTVIIAEVQQGPGITFRGGAREMWRCKDHEVILSGPSETGKTFACLHKLDTLLWKYPRSQAVVLRKTLTSLYTSVLKTYRNVVGFGTDNQAVKFFGGERPEWADYPNGSRVYFGGMDNPQKSLSSERDFIYVNQAEELELDDWEILTTRCTGRAANAPYSQILADCNPGPKSHWILQRESLTFFESKHEDNPTLYDDDGVITERGRKTIEILERLTGVRYKRLRWGIWCQAEGAWFADFDPKRSVDEDGSATEFCPAFPVIVPIDCGTSICTGSVFLQVRDRHPQRTLVTIFGDYYSEGLMSAANAEAVKDRVSALTSGRFDKVLLDPASNQRTGVGPVAFSEYQRVFGPGRVHKWPTGPVADGLDLIETLLGRPGQHVGLLIHPRCKHLIDAFANYLRAKRGNVWMGYPEDPQHPAEDLMDSLRGGLMNEFPRGRGPSGGGVMTGGPEYPSLHSRG